MQWRRNQVQRRECVRKREARDGADGARGAGDSRRLQHGVDRQHRLAFGERQRHQLQMFVRLARSRDCPAVVEAQARELRHASQQRFKVRHGQQGFLRFEAARDDEQVMLDDIELVEQGHMGVGDIRDKQFRVIGQEWIAPGAAGRACLVLASQARYLADQKPHATVLDRRLDGFDRAQRPALQGMRRPLQDRRPQRARLKVSMVHGWLSLASILLAQEHRHVTLRERRDGSRRIQAERTRDDRTVHDIEPLVAKYPARCIDDTVRGGGTHIAASQRVGCDQVMPPPPGEGHPRIPAGRFREPRMRCNHGLDDGHR
ncbi:hypothetical protein D3C72_1189060 [compost metagenome]